MLWKVLEEGYFPAPCDSTPVSCAICQVRPVGWGKFAAVVHDLAVLCCCRYKIWVKATSEQSFLYGNHILKGGLARMTEDTPKYQGVIIYGITDLPLVCRFRCFPAHVRAGRGRLTGCPLSLQGFGVTAFSTEECKSLDPTRIVVFHQADLGEYLRDEDTLT